MQITPAHPAGHYVVALHGGGIIPILAVILPLARLHTDGKPDRRDHRSADLPVGPAGQHAGVIVPKMAGLISSEVTAHGASHVSVLGDSAGGCTALASVEYLVANNQTVPASMVLLSPVVDNSFTDPNVAFLAGSWLPAAILQPNARLEQWAGNLP